MTMAQDTTTHYHTQEININTARLNKLLTIREIVRQQRIILIEQMYEIMMHNNDTSEWSAIRQKCNKMEHFHSAINDTIQHYSTYMSLETNVT